MKAVIITEKQGKFSVRFTDSMGPRLKRLETGGTKVVFAEPCDDPDKKFMLSHAIKVATNNNQQNIVDLLKAKLVKVTVAQKKAERKLYV